MLFDMQPLTLIHVLLSVAALLLGVLTLVAFAKGRYKSGLVVSYFISSALTTLTGFGFPFIKLLPSHIIGVLSSISLLVMALTYYRLAKRAGRITYVVATSISVYFLAFVAVAQAFTKLPALSVLGPGLSGPPFIITQIAVMIAFVAWTVVLVRGRVPIGTASRVTP